MPTNSQFIFLRPGESPKAMMRNLGGTKHIVIEVTGASDPPNNNWGITLFGDPDTFMEELTRAYGEYKHEEELKDDRAHKEDMEFILNKGQEA